MNELVTSGEVLNLEASGGATATYLVPPGINAPEPPSNIRVDSSGEYALGQGTPGETVVGEDTAGNQIAPDNAQLSYKILY
ncbi:hypothetical protein ACTXPD_15760 [Vreelandella alkaliphila]|uniref:hypothetical protein n=1 Tax=Halomonadaceae TaxID=28256 RepID=UPI0018684D3B|nr:MULTISPECIES: hypothetical protein [unclassified Halomonas]